jgi:hypothetical protein
MGACVQERERDLTLYGGHSPQPRSHSPQPRSGVTSPKGREGGAKPEQLVEEGLD